MEPWKIVDDIKVDRICRGSKENKRVVKTNAL